MGLPACGAGVVVALVLLGAVHSQAGVSFPGTLDAATSRLLVDSVNEQFGVKTLFGIYSVKKVKSRGVGRMTVEFEVKETVCQRPQVVDPAGCEFSRTAAPSLWECKAMLMMTKPDAPVVRYVHCEPDSSEESDSSEEMIARFMKTRPKRELLDDVDEDAFQRSKREALASRQRNRPKISLRVTAHYNPKRPSHDAHSFPRSSSLTNRQSFSSAPSFHKPPSLPRSLGGRGVQR